MTPPFFVKALSNHPFVFCLARKREMNRLG